MKVYLKWNDNRPKSSNQTVAKKGFVSDTKQLEKENEMVFNMSPLEIPERVQFGLWSRNKENVNQWCHACARMNPAQVMFSPCRLIGDPEIPTLVVETNRWLSLRCPPQRGVWTQLAPKLLISFFYFFGGRRCQQVVWTENK